MPSLLAALVGALLVRAATAHRRPRPVARELLGGDSASRQSKGEQRVQLPSEGHGTLFHRRYSVEIERPRLRRRALMSRIKADLREFSPKLLANFKKTKGHPRLMRVGDEYQISILGPWNGGVRVAEVTPTSFTLITLEGHPEAGQITFALSRHPIKPGTICFEINSWARSRDMVVSLSYDEGKVGKEVQKNVWIIFCERVVEASGGTRHGEVEVTTEEGAAEGEVVPIV